MKINKKKIQEKTNPIMMKLYKNQGATGDTSQMPNMNSNNVPEDDLD